MNYLRCALLSLFMILPYCPIIASNVDGRFRSCLLPKQTGCKSLFDRRDVRRIFRQRSYLKHNPV